MKRYLSFFLAGFLLAGITGIASAEDLVASKKSDKYHLASCSLAQKITADNKIVFKNAEEALKAGYTPCQKCNPPVVLIGSKNSTVYHLPNCKMAEKITADNQVKFNSKEEAEKAGYKPCKICLPPADKDATQAEKKPVAEKKITPAK